MSINRARRPRKWQAERQACAQIQSAATTALGRNGDIPRLGVEVRGGSGVAKGGTGILKVDGKVVATQKQPNSIAFLQVADETFDVGVDTRTGVNDKDYQVPFAFSGKIDQLTFKLGPTQLTENDHRVRQLAFAAND
jgi:hypothetical protein